MQEPINLGQLFRHAPTWDVQWDEENKCIIIDDFYEDPDAINQWLKEQNYPLWKYITPETTRNGIDYNDCRLIHSWPYDTKQETDNYFGNIFHICRRHFWKGHYDFDRVLEFNCFKAKKEFTEEMQHYPHVDDNLDTPDDRSVLNMIVYLDKGGNGGTAVYEGDFHDNTEHEDLFYKYRDMHKITKKLEYKFNRCVIFAGNRMHGAYIEDYKHYMDNWRYSQVYFLFPKRIDVRDFDQDDNG